MRPLKWLGVLLLVLAASPLHAAQVVGDVTTAIGQVQVIHEGKGQAVAVKSGAKVYFQDQITTGAASRVKVLLKDESVLSLGEKSRLTIDKAVFDPSEKKRNVAAYLFSGSVRAIVGKIFSGVGSTFEVHTDNAVASARGTHFIVRILEMADGTIRTLVGSISGDVLVQSRDDPSQSVHVMDHQVTVVGGDDRVALPEELSEREVEQMIEETEPPYEPDVAEAGASEDTGQTVLGTGGRGGVGNTGEGSNRGTLYEENDGLATPPIAQEPVSDITEVELRVLFP